MEMIVARPEFGIKCLPPLAGVDPVRIDAVEPVTELHAARLDEGERGVVDFEAGGSGVKPKVARRCKYLSRGRQRADRDRRRQCVVEDAMGIDPGHAVIGDEPGPPFRTRQCDVEIVVLFDAARQPVAAIEHLTGRHGSIAMRDRMF